MITRYEYANVFHVLGDFFEAYRGLKKYIVLVVVSWYPFNGSPFTAHSTWRFSTTANHGWARKGFEHFSWYFQCLVGSLDDMWQRFFDQRLCASRSPFVSILNGIACIFRRFDEKRNSFIFSASGQCQQVGGRVFYARDLPELSCFRRLIVAPPVSLIT